MRFSCYRKIREIIFICQTTVKSQVYFLELIRISYYCRPEKLFRRIFFCGNTYLTESIINPITNN